MLYIGIYKDNLNVSTGVVQLITKQEKQNERIDFDKVEQFFFIIGFLIGDMFG